MSYHDLQQREVFSKDSRNHQAMHGDPKQRRNKLQTVQREIRKLRRNNDEVCERTIKEFKMNQLKKKENINLRKEKFALKNEISNDKAVIEMEAKTRKLNKKISKL